MSINMMKSAGLAIGILIGLVVAVALILISNNNRKVRTEYDERQLRVRGDAYRYAFYSVIICEVILLILEFGEVALPIPAYVLHFGAIIIGCLVLCTYCIWKDAYWGLNNNRRRYGIILVVAGLLNAFPIYGSLSHRSTLDFPYVNLLTCIMLLVVGVELIVKQFLDRRAENGGESA